MPDNQQLEHKLDLVISYLRSEIGYSSESEGNINRRIDANRVDCHKSLQDAIQDLHVKLNEDKKKIESINLILNGEKGELGLIGWNVVIRRFWVPVITIIAACCGYVVNDAVDIFNDTINPPTYSHSSDQK